jgi:hypothetical protein
VVAAGLAGETDLPEKIAALEKVEFGLRDLVGLAFQVLDPAGGAFGVDAASVVSILEHKIPANAPVTPKPSAVGVTSRRSIL